MTVITSQHHIWLCWTTKETSIWEWLLIVMSVTKNLHRNWDWNHTKIISIKGWDTSVPSATIRQHWKGIWRFICKPYMRVPLTLVIIAAIEQAHQEVCLGTHKSVPQTPKLNFRQSWRYVCISVSLKVTCGSYNVTCRKGHILFTIFVANIHTLTNLSYRSSSWWPIGMLYFIPCTWGIQTSLTTTSGPTKGSGWISKHMVGNPPTWVRFPTTGWKSNPLLVIHLLHGWNSNSASVNKLTHGWNSNSCCPMPSGFYIYFSW